MKAISENSFQQKKKPTRFLRASIDTSFSLETNERATPQGKAVLYLYVMFQAAILPPPSWPHGRYEQLSGTAGPPSRRLPQSASLRVPRLAGAWATSQSASSRKEKEQLVSSNRSM
jgi:hypothetical protein